MKCRKDDMFDLKYNHIKYAHCKYVNKCKVTCKSYMLSLCLVGLLFRCACCPIVKYLFFIFLFIQGSMSRNPPSMIAYILCKPLLRPCNQYRRRHHQHHHYHHRHWHQTQLHHHNHLHNQQPVKPPPPQQPY